MSKYSGVWTPDKGIGGGEQEAPPPRSSYGGMWSPEMGIGETPQPVEERASVPASRFYSPQFDAYRRQQERERVEQWNTKYGPRETVEKFYVNEKEGVCVIYEVPDSRHPLVYVTQHPDEVDGQPVVWCTTCEGRDCTGCIWALKSFRELRKIEGILRRGDDDDGLPF